MVVGGLVWAVVDMNRWTARCERAGGTVQEEFTGFIPVIINGVPHQQPQYEYHCVRDGQGTRV